MKTKIATLIIAAFIATALILANPTAPTNHNKDIIELGYHTNLKRILKLDDTEFISFPETGLTIIRVSDADWNKLKEAYSLNVKTQSLSFYK